MLPIRDAPVVPQDEMLGRLEPGTLRWLNATPAVEAFVGQTVEQLRRRSFPEFLHPDDRALAEDEFRKAVEVGERHDFVLRIPDTAGRMRYVRVYTQARYNKDGSINHIRCYLKDVTERIQAEQELRRRTEQLTTANEQLRQANQRLKDAQSQLVHSEKLASLGTLAAGMAHEINNPLAFAMNNVAVMGRDIRDLLQLLELHEEGAADLRRNNPELSEKIDRLRADTDLAYLRENLPRMVETTRRGLQRVAKIVENLRGFAQLDRSHIAMLDVNLALDHCLGMLTDTLRQQQVTVRREYQDLPPVECAAAHVNQVFLNLLMNALQAIAATGRGTGEIGVLTRAEENEVLVEIADDGCGIPEEALPRIFDPFFTTKPVGQGTGLGLSMCHGIVAEHGGRIDVESTVGRGSKFLVRLPVGVAVPRPS
jgi:PAS domain S-box-containing protein